MLWKLQFLQRLRTVSRLHGYTVHQWHQTFYSPTNACTAIYVSAWTKCVILAKRWLSPRWWFPCKPKHVGAAFLILICFNKLYMCISWTIKGLSRVILSSVNSMNNVDVTINLKKRLEMVFWRHVIVCFCAHSLHTRLLFEGAVM